jgi:hypothetical protein
MRFSALLLLLAVAAGAATVADEVRAELLRMRDADQEARRSLIAKGLSDPVAGKQVAEVDAANTKRLKEIVKAGGWPKRSIVGDEAARAAWLLVQHAEAETLFQESALRLMERLLAKEEVFALDVAYLTDRVRVNQGRPQVYGTQTEGRSCVWRLLAVEKPDELDKRRLSVGLSTNAENLKSILDTYGPPPGCPKPTTP